MAKKVEMKGLGILNKDLIRFKQGFEALANIEASAEFSFKIIKNLRIVQKELEMIDELVKPSESYSKTYQPEVEKLAKSFCKKDKEGNPIPHRSPNGQVIYDFEEEDKGKFDKAMEKLEASSKYKDIVAERKKQIEKYTDLLDKPADVAFTKIPQAILPAVITPRQLEMIFELIED